MPKTNRGDSATAVSRRESPGLAAAGCAVLFFGGFLLAGLGFLFFISILPIYRVVQAAAWEESPCRIVSSRVERSPDGDSYTVDIRFSYLLDGVQYTSDRYDFMPQDFYSSSDEGKQKIVDRYPAGAQAVCYVDPGNPSFAVLYRGIPPATLWGLLPLLFVLVGGGGILAMLGMFGRLPSKVRQSKWAPKPMQSAARINMPGNVGRFAAPAKTGPVTLKPAASPLLKAIGLLLIAAFWNGIVSVFLVEVVNSHLEGEPQWLVTVFLIPFVLVGLLLIVGVIHTSLAIFNPRPTLTMSDSAVSLGEQFELGWRFTGNTTSLQRLRIFMEGQERAQYRRGTSTYTDENTFAEIHIVDTTNFIEISSGRRDVEIPSDSMHSFKSNHNEIAWSLRVKGEVAWWPDVDDTYPLIILPHES